MWVSLRVKDVDFTTSEWCRGSTKKGVEGENGLLSTHVCDWLDTDAKLIFGFRRGRWDLYTYQSALMHTPLLKLKSILANCRGHRLWLSARSSCDILMSHFCLAAVITPPGCR